MEEIFSFLSRLEDISNLPKAVLVNTRICKVLKRIKRLEQMPRDSELQLKQRIPNLLDQWLKILKPEEYPIISTADQNLKRDILQQREVIDLTGSPEPPRSPKAESSSRASHDRTSRGRPISLSNKGESLLSYPEPL
jgi:hypothetical protein